MSKRKTKSVPAYRMHKRSGLAVVTLSCSVTGRRRDVYLGEHGSAASRKLYADTLARWEADDRVLDGRPAKPAEATTIGRSVRGVGVRYWQEIEARYGKGCGGSGQPCEVLQTLKLLRAVCGDTPAADFGPARLKLVREAMIEKGWARETINKRIGIVKRAFKHAVSLELVRPELLVGLDSVASLPRGYKGLSEPRKVLPVPAADIDAVLLHLLSPVRGIVEVMRYTGARCDEVARLTPADLDTTGDIWRAELTDHKGGHRGKPRVFWLGPRAQAAVRPFLRRELHKPLFSPAEADAERRAKLRERRTTPESCGNRPGTNRKAEPRRKPGERYSTDSVRRAIERACDAAFPPPEGMKPEEREQWQKDHRWTPHRLRHTAATEIRKAAGLEAAAVVLGHASASITDAIYAERDEATAAAVLGRVG